MSNATIGSARPDHISDPELRAFVDRVASLLKLEALHSLTAKADPRLSALKLQSLKVGVKQQKAYPSVGMVIGDWVDKKPPGARLQLLTRIAERTVLAPELKLFGREIGFNVTSAKYGLDQIDFGTHFAFVTPSFANKLLASVSDRFNVLPQAKPDPIVVNKGLKLFCKRVKCNDETDPEWVGKDEIALGGVAVDDRERVKEVDAFQVGQFDDGEAKDYSPAKLLSSFDVEGKDYPKTFAVFLALAEKDSGGFGSFIEKLYEAVKAEVTVILMALGAAAGTLIGAAIANAVGAVVGAPLGTVIGIASGLILSELVSWLSSVLDDDIFQPQVTTVTLPSAASDFSGSLTSPTMQLVWDDFGGRYTLSYYWQLVR